MPPAYGDASVVLDIAACDLMSFPANILMYLVLCIAG
jgi:hypothetical protein